MKKKIFIFASVLLGLISPLQGKIVEAACFKEIVKHAAPGTCFLLDIDDTLLLPSQMLGNDEWLNLRIKKYQSEGLDFKPALEKGLAEWESIRHITKMKIVEEGTDGIVLELQKKHLVMGLTSQGLALATRTVQQLEENRFDLSKKAPAKDDCYVSLNEHGILFRKGILFTSGIPKGEAFFKFCDTIGFKPKRIVCIDDKASHLKAVEAEAEKRGIEFVGLRYAYADIHKAAFRADIAEIQFKHSSFERMLSDEEAKAKLIARP